MTRVSMLVFAVVLAGLVAMGCGKDESANPDNGITEVAFDGMHCTVSPATAPSGDRAFVLTNTSNIPLDSNDFFVVKVPDGYTFENLLEIQEDNGGAPKSIPEDIWYVTLAIQNEGISFASPPNIELEDDQFVFMRTLTPGTDAIELYVEGPPELQWLCGPIGVTTPN